MTKMRSVPQDAKSLSARGSDDARKHSAVGIVRAVARGRATIVFTADRHFNHAKLFSAACVESIEPNCDSSFEPMFMVVYE